MCRTEASAGPSGSRAEVKYHEISITPLGLVMAFRAQTGKANYLGIIHLRGAFSIAARH